MLIVAVSAYGVEARPKNVILIIGDGMGIGAITAARCAGPGEDGKLILDTMPVTGLLKTHSTELVTDSAASATALATGCKTENARIAVDLKGKSLPTILELARALGKSTGVVTNDGVTGATPASFYAHSDSRYKEEEIAAQLVVSSIAVAMGSGKEHFTSRGDGRDLSAEAKRGGFDVIYDAKAMQASQSKRLLGLFSFGESGPTVEAMLNKAVSVLSKNPKGFFLIAESCWPDHRGHANDAAGVVQGVKDLDDALRSAMNFARKDGNTLVVVTSDHDTGGMAVRNRNADNPGFTAAWTGGSHTGNMVALYAFGPGAGKFAGTHDNTEVAKILAGLWGKKLGE